MCKKSLHKVQVQDEEADLADKAEAEGEVAEEEVVAAEGTLGLQGIEAQKNGMRYLSMKELTFEHSVHQGTSQEASIQTERVEGEPSLRQDGRPLMIHKGRSQCYSSNYQAYKQT